MMSRSPSEKQNKKTSPCHPVKEDLRSQIDRIVDDLKTDRHSTNVQAAAKIRSLLESSANATHDCKDSTQLFDSLTQWIPETEFLILLIRWSKRTKIHFHSDSLSVVKCLCDRFRFGSMEGLLRSRCLVYTPGGKLRSKGSSKFGNRIRFCSMKSRPNNNRGDAGVECERAADVPTAESLQLSSYVDLFAELLTGNAGLGKIGMRSGQGQTLTERDMLDDGSGETEGFITANLIETHQPGSFEQRIRRYWNTRYLVYALCRLVFKHKTKNLVTYSFHLTEGAVQRFDALKILAGVCLIVGDEGGANHSLMGRYWPSDDKVSICERASQLRSDARSRAESQISNESSNHQIAASINLMNRRFGQALYYNTNKSFHERFLFLRAAIFQFWLESSASQIERLLKCVTPSIEKNNINMGTNNKRRKNSTDRTARGKKAKTKDDSTCSIRPSQPLDKVRYLMDIDRRSKILTESISTGPKISDSGAFGNRKDVDKSVPPARRPSYPVSPGKRRSNTVASKDEESVEIADLSKLAEDSAKKPSPNQQKWLNLSSATQEAMDDKCSSILKISLSHRAIDLICNMAVEEVYSALGLDESRHLRTTGPFGHVPPHCNDSYFSIGTRTKFQFGPGKENDFAIVRPGYPLFDNNRVHFAMNESNDAQLSSEAMDSELSELVRAVYRFGKSDGSRSPKHVVGQPRMSRQYRVSVGLIGGNIKDPQSLVGKQFFDRIKRCPSFDDDSVKRTISKYALFLWNVMEGLQYKMSDVPLAPDKYRGSEFAARLRQFLGMHEQSGFLAEDITIVVGVLYPNFDGCTEHCDKKNDSRPGYRRTGVYNKVLVDRKTGTLVHLQIIINFRKFIGDLTQPFTAAVNACCHNISEYISKVDNEYSRCFQRSPAGVPSCLRREKFHLFDDLFVEEYVITPKGSRIEVKLKLFLSKTGCSRVLSYSMFIEPIVALRDILKYDQLLELSFLASILVTPVLFHHVVMKLGTAHKDQDNTFLFCAHPFYDVLEEMISTVNDGSIHDGEKYNWQSFFHFRFRTSGGEVPFPTLFGAQPNATNKQREDGESTLSRIVNVLFEYTESIDNKFMGKGRDPVSDMPISSIKKMMSECVDDIAGISKCQFQMFRLGVFTTILSGAGLLQPGPHLHQLSIPVKDTGSYKHLTNPSETEYAQKRKYLSQVLRIEESMFDRAMAMIACKLGIPYERGIIETLLCEAMHSRDYLNKKDWFIQNGTIFEMFRNGKSMYREYGIQTYWKALEAVKIKTRAFLDRNRDTCLKYTFLDIRLACIVQGVHTAIRSYADTHTCRRTSSDWSGVTHTDDKAPLPKELMHYYHKSTLYGYEDSSKTKTEMRILANNGLKTLSLKGNNAFTFDSLGLFGEALIHHAKEELLTHDDFRAVDLAGAFHLQSELKDEEKGILSFYVIHKDKQLFDWVTFVPLNSSFFTITATQVGTLASLMAKDDGLEKNLDKSVEKFKTFVEGLDDTQRDAVDAYMKSLRNRAMKEYKCDDIELHSWFCAEGTILTFPASDWMHGTITKNADAPRDLLILHVAKMK